MLSTSAAKFQWNGHIELKTNEKSNIWWCWCWCFCLCCCCCFIVRLLSMYINYHREVREYENETKLSTVGELKSSNVSCATVAQLQYVNKYIEPCSHFRNLLIIFSCDFVFHTKRWKIQRYVSVYASLYFICSRLCSLLQSNSCMWMRVLWANESNFKGNHELSKWWRDKHDENEI